MDRRDLEGRIIGGFVNPMGGVDRDYRPTGVRISDSGGIYEGYFHTGFAVGGDGVIRDGYGIATSLGVNRFGRITHGY